MEKTMLVAIVICWCILGPGVSSAPPRTSESFTHSQSLSGDDRYLLFWNFDDRTITFEVHVKTLGYVGFGLSPNGGMKGADIVMGWVTQGKPYFKDRHADRNFEPDIDFYQDYELLMAKEEADYTILKFKRDLITCDIHDMIIGSDTMRVIWAYGDKDPLMETSVPYHRSTRGTKTMQLLAHHTKPPISTDKMDALAFTVSDVHVPAIHTYYHCQTMNLPNITEKHHVIITEPIIQAGNEPLVHHIVVYGCKTGTDSKSYHGDCFNGDMPADLRVCPVMFVWAVGAEQTYYPEHIGVPLGIETDPEFVVLEMHYDNPSLKSDWVDSSGIRIYMTRELRQYDSGMLTLGSVPFPTNVIPPGDPAFTADGYCPAECLEDAFAESGLSEGVKAIGAMLHAHLYGRKIRLRHFRNGTELQPVDLDDHYDFDYQQFRIFSEERIIKPGDTLLTECEYDTTSVDMNTTIRGGESTQDEMCVAFLLYYPVVSLSTCLTFNSPVEILKDFMGLDSTWSEEGIRITSDGEFKDKTFDDVIQSVKWTKENRYKLEKSGQTSARVPVCDLKTSYGQYKPPHVLKPYIAPQPCEHILRTPPPPPEASVAASVMVSQLLPVVTLTLYIGFKLRS